MQTRINQAALILFLVSNAAAWADSKPEGINQLLEITKGLKDAVCDESFISKAPSLGNGIPLQSYTIEVQGNTETTMVANLLGDTSIGIQSPALLESGPQQKRKLSLEICEGVVGSASKLKELVEKKPSRFLIASKFSRSSDKIEKKHSDGLIALIEDREGRFGIYNQSVLIPGWVEPYELEKVFVVNKGKILRFYERISNPITNNTIAVVVSSADGSILGELVLESKEKQSAEQIRSRQLDLYRSQIESKALIALTRVGEKKDLGVEDRRLKIKKLQDFYKNLIDAYKLFPEEKQFSIYSKKSSEAGRHFPPTLGGKVELVAFQADSKLDAIYAEYLEKLRSVKQ